MSCLCDRVRFHGDLIMAANCANVTDTGDDLRRQFTFDGQLEVFRVRRAKIWSRLAQVKWLERGEINSLARRWEGERKLIGMNCSSAGHV